MAKIRASAGGGEGTVITPSNSSPVLLAGSTTYKIATGKSGYAIKDYSSVTPSDASPAALTNGDMALIQDDGYAIENEPTSLAPSNSSPVSISSGTIYKASGNGKAVASVTDLTPSNSSPVMIEPDVVYKPTGFGYAIVDYQSITPSSSGTYFNAGTAKMSSSGYAVDSITTVIPSDSSPVTLHSGTVNGIGGDGYAFESSHPQFEVTNPSTSGTSARVSSYTISNKNGKKLLVLLFDSRNSAQTNTKMDSATCSGGTLTKLCNLTSSNIQVAGTVYNLDVSSDTCTITLPTEGYVQVFEQ